MGLKLHNKMNNMKYNKIYNINIMINKTTLITKTLITMVATCTMTIVSLIRLKNSLYIDDYALKLF